MTSAHVTYRVVAVACYLPLWLWDDLCRSFCCLSWVFSLQSPASIHICLLFSSSGGYVSLNSYPSDGASWWLHAGVVPAHGVTTETSLLCMNLHRLLTNLQGTRPQDHHEFKLRESLWNPPFGIQCLLLSHPLSFPHLLLTLSENKQTNKHKNDQTILTRGDTVYYICTAWTTTSCIFFSASFPCFNPSATWSCTWANSTSWTYCKRNILGQNNEL